jgi:hypothetical protein
MSLIPFAGAVQKFNRQRGGYQIERSLRFNSADSAYLNRTPAGAGNRKTWTWSGWVKRSALGSYDILFNAYSGDGSTDRAEIEFNDSDQFEFVGVASSSVVFRFRTTAVYRDPSAWYHAVVAFDSSQATESNRTKIYINGSQITAFGTETYPTQNGEYVFNNANVHQIGKNHSTTYSNAYLTEVHFIDGQALTPTSFGEFNEDTGVWQPKAYEGEYGTNGFYLDFSDNSGTTSSTLGKDQAGSNDWTPNNFSVTAGAGNDSLVDSPTRYGTDTGAGGEVRGNYATLNPLANGDFGLATLTNGNLNASGGANYFPASATFALNSGKWYWEFLCGSYNANYPNIGLWVVDGWNIGSTPYHPGITGGVSARPNGGLTTPSGDTTDAARSFVTNDIINFAYDADTGKVYIGKNGTWFNSGVPASGTGSVYQYTAGTTLIPGGSFYNGAGDYNFGARPFAYTAPSGFKALCTTNLPEPTIADGGEYFNTVLWTGTGGARTITGVGFQPDWVWAKGRSGSSTYPHLLWDAVRGTNLNLRSHLTDAEFDVTSSSNGGLGTSASDGFTIAAGSSTADNLNATSSTYVAWNWKAGGTPAVTNTDGTITSTVSVNTTSGFSIVTFTTDNTTKTVGHGLGVKPSIVLVKSRSVGGNWLFITDILGSMQYGVLNSTAAFTSIAYNPPTSTVFEYNDNSGVTQVAYCFAPVAGYSAFGSYTGNGSTDGPFVYLGFRPRYVMIKCSSNSTVSTDWAIFDTARSPYNASVNELYADLSNAEIIDASGIDILSNGFKPKRNSEYANYSGWTYIYACFSENPFQYSLAR